MTFCSTTADLGPKTTSSNLSGKPENWAIGQKEKQQLGPEIIMSLFSLMPDLAVERTGPKGGPLNETSLSMASDVILNGFLTVGP